MTKVFHLMKDKELLGVLHSYESNFPWLNCKFEATSAFEKFRPLFETELAALGADDMTNWEAAHERITELDLNLLNIDENKWIDNFLLHIEDNEAWFRF